MQPVEVAIAQKRGELGRCGGHADMLRWRKFRRKRCEREVIPARAATARLCHRRLHLQAVPDPTVAAAPPLVMVLPFLLLLLAIAALPLVAEKFWHRHHATIAVGLGAICVAYYLWTGAGERIAHVALEYWSFIALIGSLFVVAGGVHIQVRGEAKPIVNVAFLFIGAVLANVIGTTGASMLFIRPWIRMNKYRITHFHIVFFIFIVSNCGGCLTPIGDPPLLLGYLKGVPFWWVAKVAWPGWLCVVGLLLLVFYFFDRHNFQRSPREVRERETASETFRLRGAVNFGWLLIILGAVFLDAPGVRELIMAAAAAASFWTTHEDIHAANDFSFAPIKEVAFLFIGIFATMVPPLDLLAANGPRIAIHDAVQFYWVTGMLSAVLDNAPTYLALLATAMGQQHLTLSAPAQVARFVAEHGPIVLAISLGSVFFGAMTYIGNGPNFMVKSIAEHARVKTPSFFAYIFRFALPVLLPIIGVAGWIFFGRSPSP
jgi:Na+/H+ antiporter NhaD/arsenite permease-like protein